MRDKVKRMLLGYEMIDGLIAKILIYTLLLGMGFVFVLPILKMLSASFKDIGDLVDPAVGFLPSKLYMGNYDKAISVLNYASSLIQSLMLAGLPSILQTAAAAVIGYGFARYEFPGKNVFFLLTFTTFIVPPQILNLPRYLMFKQIGFLGNILAVVVPAAVGQGLKSAIFILIFYQFFRAMPKSLEEAARIDGANEIFIFGRIAIPMATPSIIVSFIFSFVWYWNETATTTLLLVGKMTTLPIELGKFTATFARMFTSASESAGRLNEGILMSGTVMTVLPILIVYFVFQRWFVEGVDRSGITGE